MISKNTIEILKKGGVIIYPTETFYAIGCIIYKEKAVKKIFEIKKRPIYKPLPVIIGDKSHLEKITKYDHPLFLKLIEKFWPGPLSVLVPAVKGISPFLLNEKHLICVRMSSHPIAKKLSNLTDSPIVATSANLADNPPVCKPEDLDKEIIKQVNHIITSPPFPKGDAPSTIIEIIGPKKVKILRPGAISKKKLEELNIEVV